MLDESANIQQRCAVASGGLTEVSRAPLGSTRARSVIASESRRGRALSPPNMGWRHARARRESARASLNRILTVRAQLILRRASCGTGAPRESEILSRHQAMRKSRLNAERSSRYSVRAIAQHLNLALSYLSAANFIFFLNFYINFEGQKPRKLTGNSRPNTIQSPAYQG